MKLDNNKMFLIGIGILIAVLFFFNNGFLFSTYNKETTTQYMSYSYDLDKLTLKYSSVSTESYYANSFKSKHVLDDPDSSYSYFKYPYDNKGFWPFYLESNGIDSSQFSTYGGRLVQGVMVYNGWTNYATSIWDESDGAYKYVLYDGSVLPYYDELVSLGFSWDYRGAWLGSTYNMNTMNDVLTDCYVEGTIKVLSEDNYLNPDRIGNYDYDYKIYGTVSVEKDRFVCNVDTSKLFNNLPDTFIRNVDEVEKGVGGAGIGSGIVVFGDESIIEKLNYYRYSESENSCTQISILPSEVTSNDYTTNSECQENIIVYDCSGSETKCESTEYFTCSNGDWSSQGEVEGHCGYVVDSGDNGNDGNNTDDGSNNNNDGDSSINWDNVLFKIGDFEVTFLMFAILVAVLILIIVFKK